MASKFGGVEVQQSRFGGVPDVAEGYVTPPTEMPKTQQRPGLGMRLVGAGDAALSMLTGGVVDPVAGVAGIVDGIASYIRGDADPLANAVSRIERIREAGTYEPKSEAGQYMQEQISKPFQMLGRQTEKYGSFVGELTRSPAAGTVARSVVELAPSALGMRTNAPGFRQRAADVEQLSGYAKDIGFDMEARPGQQASQIQTAAENLVGGQTSVAADLEGLQSAVQRAKQIEKENVSRLYEDARATSAGLPVSQARSFAPMARRALADFDVEDMPIVRKRLSELDAIAELPENAVVKLNAIYQYRQRLNRNQPAAGDLSQQAALGILKGELDSFLDNQFNADMISGDPSAVTKWRTANGAYRQYRETFDANKVVRQLATQQATPEEMRRWIFGANAVGAKKEAGEVVRRLKGIVGEDSPQFQALRQETLLDIVAPLMEETPNLRMFQKKYDQFYRNNPTLAKELFPDSVNELDKMRAFVGAMKEGDKSRLQLDIEQSLSRVMFGHGIARAAMKVSLANQVMKYMRSAAGKSERTRIMGDILGYDPGASMIPVGPVVASGAMQSQMQENQ